MASFKDRNGKNWTIDLDAYLIRDVRKACDGLDLAALNGEAYDKLDADPVLLVDTLWVLCASQANAANISQEQFASALVGDPISYATKALLESIADFSPPEKRELLRAMTNKSAKVREIGMSKALAKINDPSLETAAIEAMEASMDADLQRALTQLRSASRTPGLLASPLAE
jgi:hypothetical protein